MAVEGTPIFVAREVRRDEEDTTRQAADVYSFGKILLSMAVRDQWLIPFIKGARGCYGNTRTAIIEITQQVSDRSIQDIISEALVNGGCLSKHAIRIIILQ